MHYRSNCENATPWVMNNIITYPSNQKNADNINFTSTSAFPLHNWRQKSLEVTHHHLDRLTQVMIDNRHGNCVTLSGYNCSLLFKFVKFLKVR